MSRGLMGSHSQEALAVAEDRAAQEVLHAVERAESYKNMMKKLRTEEHASSKALAGEYIEDVGGVPSGLRK